MNQQTTYFSHSKPDYTPFGLRMSERSFNSSEYKYGFNGMEKDDELSGEGNSYTTYWRQYDPRIGRWFSLDPEAKILPWQSPYVSMDDNPIAKNDPKGDCSICDHLYSMGIIMDRGLFASDKFLITGNVFVRSSTYSNDNENIRSAFNISTGFGLEIKEVTQTTISSVVLWDEISERVTITKITTVTTVILNNGIKDVTQTVKEQTLVLGVEKGNLPYNNDTYFLDFEFPIIDELKEKNYSNQISVGEIDPELDEKVNEALEYNKEAYDNDIMIIREEKTNQNVKGLFDLPEPPSGDAPNPSKKKKG